MMGSVWALLYYPCKNTFASNRDRPARNRSTPGFWKRLNPFKAIDAHFKWVENKGRPKKKRKEMPKSESSPWVCFLCAPWIAHGKPMPSFLLVQVQRCDPGGMRLSRVERCFGLRDGPSHNSHLHTATFQSKITLKRCAWWEYGSKLKASPIKTTLILRRGMKRSELWGCIDVEKMSSSCCGRGLTPLSIYKGKM